MARLIGEQLEDRSRRLKCTPPGWLSVVSVALLVLATPAAAFNVVPAVPLYQAQWNLSFPLFESPDPASACVELMRQRLVVLGGVYYPYTGYSGMPSPGSGHFNCLSGASIIAISSKWFYPCPSGSALDSALGVCVFGCASDLQCDDGNACTTDNCQADAGCLRVPLSCSDGNVCNGTESCQVDAGCVAGTPLVCDDGQACTVDSCRPDAGCAHAIDAGACACTAGAIPPTSFKVERTVDLGSMPCIGVDGTLSASLKFSADGTATVATCGNACASEASLSTSASVAVSLCTDKVTITGSGSSSEKRSYVPECNPATCGLGCGAGYCGTDDHSGSLGVEVGRTFSKGWDKTAFGISAGLRCNGTLSGNGSVGGGRKEVSNQGDTRGTCLNCVENSVNLSGGLGISKTGCALSLGFRGSSSSVACKECLAVSGQLTGTYTSKAGACGSSSCAGLLSTVKLAAETPKLKAKTLWWDVQAQCKAAVTACGESRTCGACSCGGGTCSDLSTKFSCSVMRSGSPLIQTVSP